MKIKLRTVLPADAKDLLARDKTISDNLNLNSGVVEIDSANELLDRLLHATKNSSGIWFNPVMSFTKKEMDASRFFQLESRKTVNETEKDYELNSARLEQLDFIHTTDRCRIKLLDRVALSRVNLKPNMVAGVDQWTAEFVIASGVASVFEENRFSGMDLRPVFDPKTGSNRDDCRLLFTSNIMPPVEYDTTVQSVEHEIPEEGGFRKLGCLSYHFAQGPPKEDFFRTAENFSGNFMPFWVVSARVRRCFVENKLLGWAFRPVLEKESQYHNAYLKKWQNLIERISINPRNHF